MKRIVNFSGGRCSFFAAKRVVDRFGPLDTVLLFADTLIEDQDLYDGLKRSEDLLGVQITRISAELTPWDLFRREKMIGNNRFPICSVFLKRDLLDAWMLSHFEMNHAQDNFLLEHATLYVGFNWTEDHRTADMRAAHPNWTIEAPMQEEPIWDECRMDRESAALGIPRARLYELGFPHNNCGGRCVRAGISHWVHLLNVLPERFAEWEREEIETADHIRSSGAVPWSVLKDRRGGVHNNLYLRDLRARVESGEKFDRHDWGGCGCGGAK